MARFNNPLARVKVASPCKADWDEMIGTDRVRFCGQCSLNVYNLSAMTRDQAESVIAANEGRLCVRFYRRRDGSIITQDCPVGLRAARERMRRGLKALAAYTLAFLASLGLHSLWRAVPPKRPPVMGVMAIRSDVPPVTHPYPPEVGKVVIGSFVKISPPRKHPKQ